MKTEGTEKGKHLMMFDFQHIFDCLQDRGEQKIFL